MLNTFIKTLSQNLKEIFNILCKNLHQSSPLFTQHNWVFHLLYNPKVVHIEISCKMSN